MKKNLVHNAVIGLIVLGVTVLSSCELRLVTDSYQVVADGATLPVKYAIASGNPTLMQECLNHNLKMLNTPGLSAEERGRIALDMIDLLAVLSRVVEELVPYLSGDTDLSSIASIGDFYRKDSEPYLAYITEYELVAVAQNADPSPLQRLWGILAVGAYLYLNNGKVWAGVYSDLTNLPDNVESVFSNWISGLDTAVASSSSPGFNALIAKFHAISGI